VVIVVVAARIRRKGREVVVMVVMRYGMIFGTIYCRYGRQLLVLIDNYLPGIVNVDVQYVYRYNTT
jgi:hypothetical protein